LRFQQNLLQIIGIGSEFVPLQADMQKSMLGIFQGEPLYIIKHIIFIRVNERVLITYTIHNAFLDHAGNIDAGSILGS